MPPAVTPLRSSVPSLLALGLALGGCAAQLSQPTAVEATIASSHWPGTTVADLERGRRLYLERCSGCHLLYPPGAHPAEKWEVFVAEMVERAKLGPAQARGVTRYLAAAAESERNPEGRATASLAGRMTAHRPVVKP